MSEESGRWHVKKNLAHGDYRLHRPDGSVLMISPVEAELESISTAMNHQSGLVDPVVEALPQDWMNKLMRLAGDILDQWPESELYRADVQDLLAKHGLIAETTATAEDIQEGDTCFKPTPLGRLMLKAAAEPA